MLIYPQDPFSTTKILPNSVLTIPEGNSVAIVAAKGEFEPASFIIRANGTVSGINIIATPLSDEAGHIIPQTALDIKLVKAWYQADDSDSTNRNTGKVVLTPELLLNNDSLIDVNYATKQNRIWVKNATFEGYVNIDKTSIGQWSDNYKVFDNATAGGFPQPFVIPANNNKQIWITMHVPAGQAAGNYTGLVWVNSSTTIPVAVNFNVRVLPFTLADSTIEEGIFYNGVISSPSSYAISPEQYKSQMKDIKNHGFLYPSLRAKDEPNIDTVLQIRESIGFPKDKIYVIEDNPLEPAYIGSSNDGANRARITNAIIAWKNYTSSYGYSTLFLYGMDEQTNSVLAAERPLWQLVHANGAKVWVANDYGSVDIVKDLLDLNIQAFAANTTMATMLHGYGNRIAMYQNPQSGLEYPETYRRNYGFSLWKSGYDGTFDYAYQAWDGFTPWNDFDSGVGNFRVEAFTYPTTNGVIDTIEWEGRREAIDDIRYVQTLVTTDGSNVTATSIVNNNLANGKSSSAIRAQIIDQIITDSGVIPSPTPTPTSTPTLTPTPTPTSTPTASITVTSPNGGENWKRSTSQTIGWSFAGSPGSKVNIVLLKRGFNVGTIASNVPIGSGGKGSYIWRIPSNRQTGTDYKITVQSTSKSAVKDTSNNYFTIRY